MEARSLILLSCSHDKRAGGERFDLSSRRISSEKTLPKVGLQLVGCRKRIRELLQGGPPRLYNEDQKGGFRDERECNRQLVFGPDLAGDDTDKSIYLPAWQRYTGRFFVQLEKDSPQFWKTISSHPVEVLFVSGFYGLLLWDELIQEYECHFNDYTRDGKKQTVGEIWGSVLTDALCEFIGGQAEQPISRIYELMSESTYQCLFNWKEVARREVQIYHRVFRGLAGPDILSKLATILAQRLSAFGTGSHAFRYDQWYEMPGERQSLLRYGFESEIGRKLDATREGDLDEARTRILDRYPRLKDLPDVRERLTLAEHCWDKSRGFEAWDFGGLIVSFSTAVECYLRRVVPNCSPELTLGKIGTCLRGQRHWSELSSSVLTLNDLRRRAAHPLGPRTRREHLTQARDLAHNIFRKGEQITQTL
jgi:hypothetical protein